MNSAKMSSWYLRQAFPYDLKTRMGSLVSRNGSIS